MIKSNLPVILLKSLVLLPLEESRVELNNDISKKIIEIAEKKYDKYLLVVPPLNDLELSPDTTDIPKVGVVAKISSKIVLPNKNLRIVLTGIKRVKVLSYFNFKEENDILESVIVNYKEEEYSIIEETALYRKLMQELEKYISKNPYISNSIINTLRDLTDLEKLTDKISTFMVLNNEKKLDLMLDMSKTSRTKKLIKEMNVELAVLELENKIEEELKVNLDNMQKEVILKEKLKIIKEELGEKDTKTSFIEKIKEKLNDGYPIHIRRRIDSELIKCSTINESSPELVVTYNYIETLTSIPFGIYTKEEKDLRKIKETLDNSHYALNDVKMRITEYIAVKSRNNLTNSPIICLVGPPGVGKTTLAESIAMSLNKKYAKISLGGINDPAELIGHRKTYIGASPGKIITSLIKAGSMNPVILLDEVDKIAEYYKGDPASCLLDILDITQNKTFIDNYIEEMVDLSKVTWVLTANDLSKIPYVLLDRLEIIEVPSYLDHEKLMIAKNYLIPLIKKENGIENIDIEIPDNIINKIIQRYTKESGVRNLYRLISKIIRKIITNYSLENKELTNITINNIEEYLGKETFKERKIDSLIGLTNALAYTPYGGEVLSIEVTSYEGESEFITSGSLGNVLEESIKVGVSYIKSNVELFNIDKTLLNKTIHINFREGGIPKDGPSAGCAITTGILSYLKKQKIPNNISFTGEITLLGDILPVGGLREKLSCAIKNGITTVYVAIDNYTDVFELDDEIKDRLNIKYVNNYIEIYNDLFKEENENEKN